MSSFGIKDSLERKQCNEMNTSLHYSTRNQFWSKRFLNNRLKSWTMNCSGLPASLIRLRIYGLKHGSLSSRLFSAAKCYLHFLSFLDSTVKRKQLRELGLDWVRAQVAPHCLPPYHACPSGIHQIYRSEG